MDASPYVVTDITEWTMDAQAPLVVHEAQYRHEDGKVKEVDTGLLDHLGKPIKRRVTYTSPRRPLGFLHAY